MIQESQQMDLDIENIESQIKDLCNSIIKKTMIEKKEEIESEVKKQKDKFTYSTNTKLITLNVGGKVFMTTLQTLTTYSDSKLAKMFTGRLPIIKDDKDCFFIDRNGDYFTYILDFLRDGKLIIPTDPWYKKRINEEMEFYELVPPKALKKVWTWDSSKACSVELSNDDLTVTKVNGSGNAGVIGSEQFESGVYKWKVKIESCVNSYWIHLGLLDESTNPMSTSFNYSNSWSWTSEGYGYKLSGSGSGIYFNEGDEVEMEYDADSKEFTMRVNSKGINLKANVSGSKIYPFIYLYSPGNKATLIVE